MAGFPPSPQRWRRRRFRRVGVEILYSGRPSRIRPATTRGSPPGRSPSGIRAWPMGGRRPQAVLRAHLGAADQDFLHPPTAQSRRVGRTWPPVPVRLDSEQAAVPLLARQARKSLNCRMRARRDFRLAARRNPPASDPVLLKAPHFWTLSVDAEPPALFRFGATGRIDCASVSLSATPLARAS